MLEELKKTVEARQVKLDKISDDIREFEESLKKAGICSDIEYKLIDGFFVYWCTTSNRLMCSYAAEIKPLIEHKMIVRSIFYEYFDPVVKHFTKELEKL